MAEYTVCLEVTSSAMATLGAIGLIGNGFCVTVRAATSSAMATLSAIGLIGNGFCVTARAATS